MNPSAAFHPQRILVSSRDPEPLVAWIAARRSDLELRGRKYGEETAEVVGVLKDTVILENTIFEPSSDKKTKDKAFERMPKGEAVTITMKPGDEIDLILSKHPCKLSATDKLAFLDQKGQRYVLQDGRTVIGRDASSTIMMDPGLRDVSRLHLMIEKFDDQTVQVTDLSSHGTFIPAAYLEHHTIQ